jgi:DNA-binding transcriptional MerR regulator
MRTKTTATMFRAPERLYRIGDIIRYTPFSRQTIHNYTTMGLIKEAQWTQGGHRLYDESVFRRLSKIIELRKNKTLFEIRRILKNKNPEPRVVQGASRLRHTGMPEGRRKIKDDFEKGQG